MLAVSAFAWTALALASALAPSHAAAQASPEASGALTRGSPYLPLGHWAYDYIDILVARGKLEDLQPLVQPYRRSDIARAIGAAASGHRLSYVEEEWAASILRELRSEVSYLAGESDRGLAIDVELEAGLKGLTQTHRDPLRPEGPEKLWLTFGARAYGGAPALAGAFDVRWDGHYLNDPQFPDGRAIEFRECDPIVAECAYRVEDAYVEIQVPYVRLFFGRMGRNWGLAGARGLQLSDYAYSYDHLGYRFGNDRIALTGLFAPFHDFTGDTTRFYSSHRLDWRVRDNLSLAVGESVMFGGENRQIDFSLINPVGIWEISGSSGKSERNSSGFVEAWWRPFQGFLSYGTLMIDNTSVGDQEEGRSQGLNQYAFSLGFRLPQLSDRLALDLDLSVVSALAYRSRVAFYEYYTKEALGIARDVTDAVQVGAVLDWYALRGLILKPGLQIRWKGEDDLTDPFPEDAFGDRKKLLVGTIETTIRPIIAGRWHLPRSDSPFRGLGLDLEWDLGLNIVRNKDHQTSDWDADLVGALLFSIRQAF